MDVEKILSEIPIHLTKIQGEMVTPTCAAIVAALHTGEISGKVIVRAIILEEAV